MSERERLQKLVNGVLVDLTDEEMDEREREEQAQAPPEDEPHKGKRKSK